MKAYTDSRSSPSGVFCKISFYKSIAKFTGKHLLQNLFSKSSCNFIEQETPAHVLFHEFCKISNHSFFCGTLLVAGQSYVDKNI